MPAPLGLCLVNLSDAAIIALGSNLGDSAATLAAAMDRLRNLSAEPIRASSLWQTVPVDCPPGAPMFTNAVVALMPRAGESPERLLEKLQEIEREFGRQRRGVRNEARTLDLDLIAFGSQVRTEAALTLPHPRAHQRAFVLAPLNELDPEYLLPEQTQPVKTLLAGLAARQETTAVQRAPEEFS